MPPEHTAQGAALSVSPWGRGDVAGDHEWPVALASLCLSRAGLGRATCEQLHQHLCPLQLPASKQASVLLNRVFMDILDLLFRFLTTLLRRAVKADTQTVPGGARP